MSHPRSPQIWLHLSRVLLSAIVTISVVPVTFLFIDIGERLLRGRTIVTATLLRRFMKGMPTAAGMFGVLLGLVAVVLLVLWVLPVTRRWFSAHTWAAAIGGACCGLLVSPAWFYSFRFVLPYYTRGFSWEAYLDALPVLGTLAAVAGALFGFLHAFFVNRAVRKREWLAAQAEHSAS